MEYKVFLAPEAVRSDDSHLKLPRESSLRRSSGAKNFLSFI